MLEQEKTRTKKLYSIGYSSTLNQYILATIVCGMFRYKRYFRITKNEYQGSVKALDEIAWSCHTRATQSWRFLCSDKSEENTNHQDEIHSKLSEGMVRFQYTKVKYF